MTDEPKNPLFEPAEWFKELGKEDVSGSYETNQVDTTYQNDEEGLPNWMTPDEAQQEEDIFAQFGLTASVSHEEQDCALEPKFKPRIKIGGYKRRKLNF